MKNQWDALKDSNSGEASEADYMKDLVELAVLGYELDEDLNRLAKKYRRKAETIAQRLGLKTEIGFVVADGGQTVLSVLKSEKIEK